MRKTLFLSLGIAALLAQGAAAQTVLYNESWENTSDGWGTTGGNMTFGGFSSTLGVTEGNYSAILATTGSGPNYAAQWGSSASTALTTALAESSSVTLDVYTPPGSFGYYLQFDLALNQTGGLGYQSVDNYNYQATTIGSETVLTWTVPASQEAILAANSALPTSVNIQIGGGFSNGSDAAYLDDFTISQVPEPSTIALASMGAVALIVIRCRKFTSEI